MSLINRIDTGFPIAPPGQTGEVIDATDRFVGAPDGDHERFYFAVYGAGTFVVRATSPEAAGDIAQTERALTEPEIALPLAVPLSADEEHHFKKVYPAGAPNIKTIYNPITPSTDNPLFRASEERRLAREHQARKDEEAPETVIPKLHAGKGQGSLFCATAMAGEKVQWSYHQSFTL